jgi:predicted enzyme related to lactoylglutathione lyase
MSENKRENQIDYVEFPATSGAAMAAAKKFYQEAFGWAFQDWGDDYADTKDSGIGSGINADLSHRPAAPLVVLFSADIEATHVRVIKAGGKITKDIFHYIDPAGNQLAVWSDK